MILNYKMAKKNLLAANIDGCQQFFEKNGNILELAYTELLLDNVDKAEKLFLSIIDKDIRAHWGLVLIAFIKGVVNDFYPSYFEIRNFLEIDLNILINYYKGDYVEKIIRYSDFMFTINPEVYKFVGRVFWNTDLKEQAEFFFYRAKSYFYHDPELHFLLAEMYLQKKDNCMAIASLNDCLQVLPNYFPAVDLLKKLTK